MDKVFLKDKILRVENLSKEGILSQITFEMERGEMLAVMGPSGSGKSTLLYHAAGMMKPSDGKIWLENMEISGMSEDERAGIRLRDMGFIFQQMNMMANLNILDNILLPAVWANRSRWIRGKRRKAKRSGADMRKEAKALMQKLDLSGLEERRITQVSGGQLQRACICRSMINSPKILFADEPTGALNRSAAKEVMEELIKLNSEGTAVLMVTHDSRVASCCERILYLLDGRIRGELRLGKMAAGNPAKEKPMREESMGEKPSGEKLLEKETAAGQSEEKSAKEKRREEMVDKWLGKMGW